MAKCRYTKLHTCSQPQDMMKGSGQLHASAALTTGKEPAVPTEQLTGQDQELFWMYWRKENTLHLQETEPHYFSYPVCILVPTPTDILLLLTVPKENGNLFQIVRTANLVNSACTFRLFIHLITTTVYMYNVLQT